MLLLSTLSHPVVILLLVVSFGLLLAIILLGYTVLSAMDIYREKIKNKYTSLCFAAIPVVEGIPDSIFYLLVTMIGVELLVILALLHTLRVLTGIKRKARVKTVRVKKKVNWVEKLNQTKSLDAATEAEADMGHDYDGIRELNNPTPPWWRWGFYFSILFGVVYVWRFHISETAPLQLEELKIAEAEAAVKKEAYLKNAANNIDENNVKLLTEATDLETGKKLFSANCAACHGPEAQGLVGPNLTDDYWLHGGKVPDVFKTIKYGVPEKGMKSWKDDFSPKQLAQLTSFIKSVHGSNPPNPKAQEGQKDGD